MRCLLDGGEVGVLRVYLIRALINPCISNISIGPRLHPLLRVIGIPRIGRSLQLVGANCRKALDGRRAAPRAQIKLIFILIPLAKAALSSKAPCALSL